MLSGRNDVYLVFRSGTQDGQNVDVLSFESRHNMSWWVVYGRQGREKTPEQLFKIFGLRNWLARQHWNGEHCENTVFGEKSRVLLRTWLVWDRITRSDTDVKYIIVCPLLYMWRTQRVNMDCFLDIPCSPHDLEPLFQLGLLSEISFPCPCLVSDSA